MEAIRMSMFSKIAEKVGKDRRGNPVYVRDDDGAEIVFPKVIEEFRKNEQGESGTPTFIMWVRTNENPVDTHLFLF